MQLDEDLGLGGVDLDLDSLPPAGLTKPSGAGFSRLLRILVGAVVPALLVLSWWGTSRSGILCAKDEAARVAAGESRRDCSPKLPRLGEVVDSGGDFLFGAPADRRIPGVIPFKGGARIHVPSSVGRWLVAYAVAVAVGLPLGLGLGLSRRTSLALDPLVQAFRAVPITAWAPIAIVWFGYGEGAARFLVYIGAFYPVVIATTDAARRVPRQLVDTARMLGTPRRALARRVYVRAAMPGIVTGLRLGLILGWTSLIVGEITGQETGLGAMMFAAREVAQLDQIIVGMVAFAVIGLVGDLVLRAVTRPVVAWADR